MWFLPCYATALQYSSYKFFYSKKRSTKKRGTLISLKKLQFGIKLIIPHIEVDPFNVLDDDDDVDFQIAFSLLASDSSAHSTDFNAWLPSTLKPKPPPRKYAKNLSTEFQFHFFVFFLENFQTISKWSRIFISRNWGHLKCLFRVTHESGFIAKHQHYCKHRAQNMLETFCEWKLNEFCTVCDLVCVIYRSCKNQNSFFFSEKVSHNTLHCMSVKRMTANAFISISLISFQWKKYVEEIKIPDYDVELCVFCVSVFNIA